MSAMSTTTVPLSSDDNEPSDDQGSLSNTNQGTFRRPLTAAITGLVALEASSSGNSGANLSTMDNNYQLQGSSRRSEQAATATATTTNPSLLREWNYPPVAPAVVVEENGGERTVINATMAGAAPQPTTAATAAASPSTAAQPAAAQAQPTEQTQQQATSSSSSTEPQEQQQQQRSPFAYPYPVATFVQSLVRPAIDPLSIRSADDIDTFEAASSNAHHQQHMMDQHQMVSARTVDDIDYEEAEFILVDGDLIALPPPPPNQAEQEGLEEDSHSRAASSAQQALLQSFTSSGLTSCHKAVNQQGQQQQHPNGSRVKRGVVRRIGKWLRPGRKTRNRSTSSGDYTCTSNELQAPTQVQQAPPSSPPHSPRGAPAGPAVAVTTGLAPGSRPLSRQSSAGDTTASPHTQRSRRQQGRNLRKSFLKGSRSRAGTGNEVPETLPTTSISPPFGSERDDTATSLRTVPSAATGNHDATTGLLSAVQLQLQQEQQQHQQQQVAAAAAAAAARLNHHHQGQPASASSARIPRPTAVGMDSSTRTQSVTASLVGTADQLPEAGVLPAACASAEAHVEYFYDDEKLKQEEEEMPLSLVPVDTDYKVDKADAPDVGEMLLRAAFDTTTDLEGSELSLFSAGAPTRGQAAKIPAEGASVPLSQAHATDRLVHNDTLKVCLVGAPGVDKSTLGRAIRQSTKRPRKRTTLGVDVHTWAPSASGVKFQLWDVQGATTTESSSPNFGAHPATQSLFFSGQSLYLLVWDLACHNPHTFPVVHEDDGDDDSDDEDDEDGYGGNDCDREESYRQADRALQEDIQNRVLSWVDTIARRAPRSAILPVAIIPDHGMTDKEAKRRCDKMQALLEMHMQKYQGDIYAPNVVLDDSQTILCVDYKKGFGVKQLQETMVAIATDTSRSVFDHVGTPVPPGTVEVLELIRRVKHHHKFISLDHVLGELGASMSVRDVTPALYFLSSIGEILYFGTSGEDVLSSFVVLSRKWLVSALSCIMRNDLRREVSETRRFMNMQCIYSEQKYHEDEIIRTLAGDDTATSNCPLLSADDSRMLWQSMSFMREAADRYSQLNESSTTAPTMFYFLHELLVHAGIFLPLESSSMPPHAAGIDNSSQVFFVPSLLTQADPGDIWSYNVRDSYTTTLCHSWLFRDGAPEFLFEHMTAALLKDLYTFSRTFQNSPLSRDQPHRVQTVPLGRSARSQFLHDHETDQAIGPIRIHQVVCWKSAMLLKIGTTYPEKDAGNEEVLKESLVEIFVAIVDQNSSRCVSSDAMRANMQRIVVSGKGLAGHHAKKLWKGGYRMVLDSIQASLANYNNVNMQVVCPECLSHGNPRRASTWSWDEVLAAAGDRSQSTIVCRRGHRGKSNLLCGTCKEETHPPPEPPVPTNKPVSEIFPAVVLVGLWDSERKEIRNVGSGFIADKRLGLIVTAGHVLCNMEEGQEYGAQYFGLSDARVVIGVIPEGESKKAVFRYFGEIVTSNIDSNVDACVVRITSKMQNDVDDEGNGCASQPEIVLDTTKMKDENLSKLKMETDFAMEDAVRVLGFNQGGGGLLEPGRHVLRSADFAKGYICGNFDLAISDDSSASSDAGSRSFMPLQEIICIVSTIAGHSGGPCVNNEGLVVGILSRVDPVQKDRCYLVPAKQLKDLLKRARNVCSRPVYPTTRPQLSKLSTM